LDENGYKKLDKDGYQNWMKMGSELDEDGYQSLDEVGHRNWMKVGIRIG
jgi:hypothetical protein